MKKVKQFLFGEQMFADSNHLLVRALRSFGRDSADKTTYSDRSETSD